MPKVQKAILRSDDEAAVEDCILRWNQVTLYILHVFRKLDFFEVFSSLGRSFQEHFPRIMKFVIAFVDNKIFFGGNLF